MATPKLPVILAVEHVRSLYNIGSFFRTADGANIQEVLLSPFCATPPRAEISKTALGGEQSILWRQGELAPEINKLKEQGYTICALEQSDRSTPLYTTDLRFPLVLIVGHEREGVSQELLVLCDHHVELPMQGETVHSLNVSNATAIALYELGRRFWYDKSSS